MQKVLTPLIAGITLLAGCATQISEERRTQVLLPEEDTALTVGRRPEGAPTFLRVYRVNDASVRPVRLAGVPLSYVLAEALPDHQAVAIDSGVLMDGTVSIASRGGSAAQFLEDLGRVSGYDFKIVGEYVEVRSVITEEWTLAAVAGRSKSEARVQGGSSSQNGQGAQGVGGASQSSSSGGEERKLSAEFTSEIDEWESIVSGARAILEGKAGAPSAPTPIPVFTDSAGQQLNAVSRAAPAQTNILSVRSIGLIQATGPVSRIRAIDSYLSSVQVKSQRQVRLSARFVEVSLSDSKSQGIDWSALGQHFFSNGVKFGLDAGGDFSVGTDGLGGFNLGLDLEYGDESLTALMSFLARYGDVTLRDQPQATTTNGKTVYIGSGEEFGYISAIQQAVTQGAIATTGSTQRILIGVEMAVTPRVLDDGRVLIEIVPVVSTFRGFDDYEIDGNVFSQPRITLKQLATQVITRSGEPVQIGGLISSRLTSELRKLPVGDKETLGLGPLFEAQLNTLDRTELILLVTPYLEET